jgi:hypothetical protein
MKFLTGVAIILLVFFCMRQLVTHWNQVRSPNQAGQTETAPAPAPPSGSLSGLPPHLEPSLQAAQRQGANALKTWLAQNRRSIQDPRLAAIELDYVLLVAGKNFGEAKEVFQAVRQRTPTNSPIHPRVQQMERTYR